MCSQIQVFETEFDAYPIDFEYISCQIIKMLFHSRHVNSVNRSLIYIDLVMFLHFWVDLSDLIDNRYCSELSFRLV